LNNLIGNKNSVILPIHKKTTMNKSIAFGILLTILICITGFREEMAVAQTANSPGQNETVNPGDFKTEFVWDAKVKIGVMIMVGESKR
jgi:hypothetical protein